MVAGLCLLWEEQVSRNARGNFDQEMEYRGGRAELTAAGFAQRGHQARN